MIITGLTNLPIVEVATIVGALGGGSILGYEYRRFREKQQNKKNEIELWFDECQNIVSRGIHTTNRARWRSDIEYSAIVDDLDEFAERLLIKSRKYPKEIPTEVVEQIASLSQLYSKATNVAEVSSQKEGIELTTELFEMAQRESSADIEYEEAINEAGTISDQFQNIISIADDKGMKTDELVEIIKEMFTEWDSEDFANLMTLTAGSSDNIDNTIEQIMRIFLEMVEKLSDMAYEMLENHKKEVI